MDSKAADVIDQILARRSIRVYSPGDVPETAVKRMLEAAMAAPSAMTKDPWRFVVVRNATTLRALAEVLPGGKMLNTVPLGILVCGDSQVAFEQNIGYLVQDCSAAIQNLLLAVHGLGFGGCWVGAYPSEPSMHSVRKLLGIPGHVIPVACVAVGVRGEEPGPRTRYTAASVHSETWQETNA